MMRLLILPVVVLFLAGCAGENLQTVGMTRFVDETGRRCNNIPVYDIQKEELASINLIFDVTMINSADSVHGCLFKTISTEPGAAKTSLAEKGHATAWMEFSRFPSGRSLNSLSIHWFTSRNGAWDNLLESSGIDGSPHSQFTETVENWGEINVIMRQVPQERTYSLYALVNQPAQNLSKKFLNAPSGVA